MHTRFITIAVASVLATPALAASNDVPPALRAIHADFEAQLETAAATPGAIGTAARRAADLLTAQNAAQEALVLPLLGRADTATTAQAAPAPASGETMGIEAALSHLYDADVGLVTALVELYAAADEAGQPGIATTAQRVIWHETSDIDVLYPAALTVSALPDRTFAPTRSLPMTAGPMYGPGPFPMMGVGSPHPPAPGNPLVGGGNDADR